MYFANVFIWYNIKIMKNYYITKTTIYDII